MQIKSIDSCIILEESEKDERAFSEANLDILLGREAFQTKLIVEAREKKFKSIMGLLHQSLIDNKQKLEELCDSPIYLDVEPDRGMSGIAHTWGIRFEFPHPVEFNSGLVNTVNSFVGTLIRNNDLPLDYDYESSGNRLVSTLTHMKNWSFFMSDSPFQHKDYVRIKIPGIPTEHGLEKLEKLGYLVRIPRRLNSAKWVTMETDLGGETYECDLAYGDKTPCLMLTKTRKIKPGPESERELYRDFNLIKRAVMEDGMLRRFYDSKDGGKFREHVSVHSINLDGEFEKSSLAQFGQYAPSIRVNTHLESDDKISLHFFQNK